MERGKSETGNNSMKHRNNRPRKSVKEKAPLCRYGPDCQTENCRFIHPLMSFTDTSMKNKAKQTKNPQFNKKREIQALNIHKNRIADINEYIKRIDESLNAECFGTIDEQNIIVENKEALQNQINQLTAQIEVYNLMKLRAHETFFEDSQELSQQVERELYRLESSLPVFAKRLEIEKVIEDNPRIVIIQGQTGSGKSTQIPQYVADHPNFYGKRVICTQPRKIACEALATRVAFEYAGGTKSSSLGQHVGYHVGGRKLGRSCRIEFITEGVMLERIMKGNPSVFNNVGCIIIDEAHERSITCDILLGSLKKGDPRWKDILIIVMSATIDLKLFRNYFQGAPVLEIEGRIFPVTTIYEPLNDNSDIRSAVSKCAFEIHQSRKAEPGDILCFLPGQEDVLVAKVQFENHVAASQGPSCLLGVKALALYGKQDPEQQALVFEKLPKNIRKIVFSTDLAETSVTIDGVKFVVDSGVKKEVVYDPKRNISSLKVNTISKSSAIQRAGRSGRTQPGECHRLYSEDDFEKMHINTAPEIFRKQLSVAVLTLREMNFDPLEFDWISAPSKEALSAAEVELKMLKAIDSDNNPTELGKLISTGQQDPKLVRMIYSGCKDGFGIAAVTLASIMTVSDIFFWRGNSQSTKSESKKQRQKFLLPEGDFVSMYRVFQEWENILERGTIETKELHEAINQTNKKAANDWCMKSSVNSKAMNLALSTRKEFINTFKASKIWKLSKFQNKAPTNENLQKIIFSGYFLQTARIIRTRSTNTPFQYYAIHSDVTGQLDFNSAFICKKEKSTETPQWIIYDRIFRLTVTIFPSTSAIDENWLREENPEFYRMCMEKLKSLPTETITKFLSHSCLQMIMGKCYRNLESLEEELGCSIMADGETGQLTAFCSLSKKPSIEKSINDKITDVVQRIRSETIEEEYLGGSRVVIGQGYEIKQVLFPQEFTTIYIRNLPQEYDRQTVERLLLHTGVNWNLQSVEIMSENKINNAVAKFTSKSAAKMVYDKCLKWKLFEEKNITVSPKLGPRKGVTQGISTRLKLSWAAGASTGIGTIWFNDPNKANQCIENFKDIFPEAFISYVQGEKSGPSLSVPRQENRKANSNGKPLPPVKTVFIPNEIGQPKKRQCRFRFDTEQISEMFGDVNMFEYQVTVVDLPLDVDEYEITRRIQSYNPRRVKVKRNFEKKELTDDERKNKLSLIRKFIKEDGANTSDFFETQYGRAGVFIYFNNNSLAKDAYSKRIDYNSMAEKPFSQPHRLEIEYTHQMSIHVDLFQFLEETLDEFKMDAKWKGVTLNQRNPKNNRSKFVFLSCRTNRQANILWVQQRLNTITTPIQFVSEKSNLLFTWTGKSEMETLSKKTFIHSNRNNHWIWIYGSEEIKTEVIRDIERIVRNLSLLQVIDTPIELDKKKVDVNGKVGAEISRMCKINGIEYFRFHGNTLYLSGKKSSIENVESFLERNSFKRKSFKTFSYEEDNRECGLCTCPCDGKFIVLSLCSHVFCLECIGPMLGQQPPPFPVQCPICTIPLALNDILKCAPQGSLQKTLELAIPQYQQKHSAEVRLCPANGCNQLLSYSSRTEGKAGGEFIFCDECMTTYCILCSAKLPKPVVSHEDESCEDVQSGVSVEVSKLVRDIQDNILNLNCPRCNAAFLEFDGCAAVACGNCPCNFCGLCLQDCGNSSETHTHVLQCPKNKGKSYFIDQKALDTVHRDMRIQKIKDYFAKTRNVKPNTLQKVLTVLHKDLSDLGIDTTLIMSGIDLEEDDTDSYNQFVRHIRDNILNLSCPRCKTTFFEFEGCAAVVCGSCPCNFCGLCLKDCGNSDQETYTHIRQCPRHTKKNEYYPDKTTVDQAHRELRIQKIKDYMLQSRHLRKATLEKCINGVTKDLLDLGIDADIFKPFIGTSVALRNNEAEEFIPPEQNLPHYARQAAGVRDRDHEQAQLPQFLIGEREIEERRMERLREIDEENQQFEIRQEIEERRRMEEAQRRVQNRHNDVLRRIQDRELQRREQVRQAELLREREERQRMEQIPQDELRRERKERIEQIRQDELRREMEERIEQIRQDELRREREERQRIQQTRQQLEWREMEERQRIEQISQNELRREMERQRIEQNSQIELRRELERQRIERTGQLEREMDRQIVELIRFNELHREREERGRAEEQRQEELRRNRQEVIQQAELRRRQADDQRKMFQTHRWGEDSERRRLERLREMELEEHQRRRDGVKKKKCIVM